MTRLIYMYINVLILNYYIQRYTRSIYKNTFIVVTFKLSCFNYFFFTTGCKTKLGIIL